MNYNIYWKNFKINRFPLRESDITEISKQNLIRKNIFGELKEIPVSQLRIVKCTVV